MPAKGVMVQELKGTASESCLATVLVSACVSQLNEACHMMFRMCWNGSLLVCEGDLLRYTPLT